jgi:RHS repeat-associated protein
LTKNSLSDHLNTPRLIADDQQRTVWRWDNTDPFGGNPPDENPSGLGTFEFPLRFPGQYADRETNLHYNYFRDYDPGVGRYVQSDPIGLMGGLNNYAYVEQNPLRFVDDEALQTLPPIRTVPILPVGPLGRLPGQPGYQLPLASSLNQLGPFIRSNQSQCVQQYLAQNYGPFVQQTLIPSFSAVSYLPGSGFTTQAWASTLILGVLKGAAIPALYGAGAVLNAIGGAGAGIGVAPMATAGQGLMMTGATLAVAAGVGTVGATSFATTANLQAMLYCAFQQQQSCSP